jgi:hypothetical protein
LLGVVAVELAAFEERTDDGVADDEQAGGGRNREQEDEAERLRERAAEVVHIAVGGGTGDGG